MDIRTALLAVGALAPGSTADPSGDLARPIHLKWGIVQAVKP